MNVVVNGVGRSTWKVIVLVVLPVIPLPLASVVLKYEISCSSSHPSLVTVIVMGGGMIKIVRIVEVVVPVIGLPSAFVVL